MSPRKSNDDDERIEELLSQLQGIFGKLSQNEEKDESSVDPAVPSSEPAPSENVAHEPPPAEPQAPPKIYLPAEYFAKPESPPSPPTAESEPPLLSSPNPAWPEEWTSAITPSTMKKPPETLPESEVVQAPTPPQPAPVDPSHKPVGILYPIGREAEATTLSGRLQTLSPKFTKVPFQLRIAWMTSYDLKNDWKEELLQKSKEGKLNALFVIVDRPVEETRRKTITSALEAGGIYFQEVPLVSIEKKAFYTDLLLGLVFFFDSLKS